MAKMTDELIKLLYSFGKKVYANEVNLQDAAIEVMRTHGSSIAKSSAEFYIGLVKELISGKGSTWNQNSDLLVYYVDHIASEYGIEAGSKAYIGGMKFAKLKSRKPLIDALEALKDKYHFTAEAPDNQMDEIKEQFKEWMKAQNHSNGSEYKEATINRYAKALETIAEQIEGLDLPSTNLFYYTTVSAFSDAAKTIRENHNFDYINTLSRNGNGDLSAGMNQYMRFLYEREGNMSINSDERQAEDSIIDEISLIKRYIASEGFNYDDGLIENFYLSLKAKPFVLLAGTSGTGKTRLVRLFAEAIGAKKKEKDDTEENNSRYLQVAVKPDWSDSTDLFGHVNLKNEFVPGAIIEFIKKAEDDPEKLPYILCLDEMNLARVEYYFSDFLSVMETRDRKGDSITTDRLIPKGCYSGDEEAGKLYADLIIPENLYIVGTVNMDETTFPFSKKVLDRANTIEFSHVDFELSDEFDDKEVAPAMVGNDFLKANYLNLKKDCKDRWESVKTFNDTVSKVNDILKKGDAHFGYRMRDEIIFYMLYNEDMGLLPEKEAFDNQIMQKILPRIQGSSETTANLLKELFTKVCAGPYTSKSGQTDARKMQAYLSDGGIADYPKSAKKICMMLRRYEDDDFTSFWV